jgi:hypothetical protein
MSLHEKILDQALALPPEDRAFVAVELERSLCAAPDTDEGSAQENGAATAAFHAELQRRSAAYRAGSTTARGAEDVLADLERRQTSYWLDRAT